jgi:hypothetical protein
MNNPKKISGITQNPKSKTQITLTSALLFCGILSSILYVVVVIIAPV